jgi:hypothetical protein
MTRNDWGHSWKEKASRKIDNLMQFVIPAEQRPRVATYYIRPRCTGKLLEHEQIFCLVERVNTSERVLG